MEQAHRADGDVTTRRLDVFIENFESHAHCAHGGSCPIQLRRGSDKHVKP